MSDEPVHNLERDLASVLNRYSQENISNTPDFILAAYLLSCLTAFNAAIDTRAQWYGRMDAIGGVRPWPPTNEA